MSGYASIRGRESLGSGHDDDDLEENGVRLGMIDDELHGAHIDYASAHARRDVAPVLAEIAINDKENVDLNASIMGVHAGKHEKEKTRSLKLNNKQPMENMEVRIAAERKPTQVGKRRFLGLISLGAFFGVLLAIVLQEGASLHEGDIIVDSISALSDDAGFARKDVVLFGFSHASNRSVIRWNNGEVLGGLEIGAAIAKALDSVPFADFSVEMRVLNESDPVQIACVKRQAEATVRVPTKSLSCASWQTSWATPKVVASLVSVNRCMGDTISAIKSVAECGGGSFQSADDQADGQDVNNGTPHKDLPSRVSSPDIMRKNIGLQKFWQKVFAQARAGVAFSSRCCDFDDVYTDASRINTLEMCAVPLSKVNSTKYKFLEYYTREGFATCAAQVCGCTCFADKRLSQASSGGMFSGIKQGCPAIVDPSTPESGAKRSCQALVEFLTPKGAGEMPSCSQLPDIALRNPAFFHEHGIELGAQARCYGDDISKL